MASDADAITALVHTYAERFDNGDLEAVAELFARATLRVDGFPEVHRGSAEVLDLYRSTVTLYDGRPCTKHVTTNLIVDVDAVRGTAAARSYFTVLQARPELPLQIIIAGRYHDQFARDSSVSWHFTNRLMFIDLIGDLRFHLKVNPLDA